MPVRLSEEERSEVERHAVVYRDSAPQSLDMVPNDWEKFDVPAVPLNPYVSSISKLGDVNGLLVLDAGCGDGWLSVILAKRGARVVGFDISDVGVKIARQRAIANGVERQCHFVTASFYSMPFETETFDAVIGQSILHHLGHKSEAAIRLRRVMKPGAIAVFAEPFGNSHWLERLRLLVPIASEAPEDPTEWAHQFKYSDLAPFASGFAVSVEEFQFFSRIDRLVQWKPLLNLVARIDRQLLRRLRWLRPYARGIVIELQRT